MTLLNLNQNGIINRYGTEFRSLLSLEYLFFCTPQ
jgi:hypothetical protein